MRLVVAPSLGAKVVSLIDRRSGREWLDARPQPSRIPSFGDAFDAAAAYGWDECFPTVAVGDYPDHGELWSRPWSCSAADDSVATEIEGLGFPYLFRRSLELASSSVIARYELHNRGTTDFPCLWSMHPLFALRPDMRLELPQTLASLAGPIDTRANGWAKKVFSDRLRDGRALVATAEGGLELCWDVAALPFLGLWLNHDGWPAPGSGLRQVALEPTSGDSDDLAVALERGGWVVPAGGHRVWSVELRLLGSERTK